ncbi:sulfonate ABC transporter permease [Paenibacillus sp. 598K]|uniref:ABC transporter permease n=1 Tax=Paenibacillus sp. 598K TaxID=1117987 RepID=UPI000FF8FF9A|nr:ABC transporter permease [Paenibacillus sp. 598K]GBF76298.1 sulfonate ABC transporter permease [Paenibacillus sp. 598K]
MTGKVRLAYGVAGVALLLALWQLLVLLRGAGEALFPSPLGVARGIAELVDNGILWKHLKVSLGRFIVGYLSACVIAVALGLALGRVQPLWALLDPVIQLLRPVSPIAWAPFIVLWFGIGDAPAIVIIFIAAFFPVLLSTVAGVRSVSPIYLKVAQNMELSRAQLTRRIILPAAFPTIAGGLHLAIGTSWIFLVSGEMVGAQSGLGFLIIDSRNTLRMDLVMAGIVLIGSCGLLLDRAVRWFEYWVETHWGSGERR